MLEKNIHEIMDQTGRSYDEARECIASYYADELGEGLADWMLEILLERDNREVTK